MAVGSWAARLERALTEQEEASALALLPPERRARLMRMQSAQRRMEPLCAYLLLRVALRQRYGWQELPEMERSAAGKPFFPDWPQVHFNLSHTDGAVLVGVGEIPLGVDIQRIRPVRRQAMQCIAGADEEQAFFQSWVRREARTKCTGEGIASMMRGEPPLRKGEQYHVLTTFPGYVAGLAVWSPDPPEPIQCCTLDQLLRP